MCVCVCAHVYLNKISEKNLRNQFEGDHCVGSGRTANIKRMGVAKKSQTITNGRDYIPLLLTK